ncbi:beta-alanyl-bioamine nonribosomal peptide synthetase ebony-like [Neodiprion pinetum]|uniref:beta-alanyl-bioamine nonribosomal peptide synthetase ebony-like n=1 Tax=Neodiprion pinetum TaxID=441929 RepID=UPI001EE101E7|nr:dimodular nonribosomal peptide synthase-like [Neodiprion pinetum]XP_046473916.1 dimodular nonribosomal peptide synthase-like [Neodiprion pinetum]
MSSLEEPSILKGNTVDRSNEEVFSHKVFSQVAVNNPNHTAIIYEDERGEETRLTFSQLEARTNQLSRVLAKRCRRSSINGVDAIVAISMRPTDRLPTLLLATLKAGMAYLPLDPEFPAPRVEHILTEAEPLIVVSEEGADMTIYEGTPAITYEKLLEEASNESTQNMDLDACQDLAIVLYTSGSTGVPKGVKLLHDTLINSLRWQWNVIPYSPTEERCVFKATVTSVDSVPEIWGPLLQGRCIVVVPKHITRDPQRLVQLLEKHKIERLAQVPSLLRTILMYLDMQQDKHLLKNLKLWICSGEVLPLPVAEQFLATFPSGEHTLANLWGGTELTGDVTYHLINHPKQLKGLDKVPIGKPAENCILYVVDKKLQLVPPGELGEVVCAGKYLAAGYVKGRDPHRFVDNPHSSDPEYSRIYRTGDYARIVKGILIYEGRMDNQIKVRGHRVDIAEVEKAVLGSPAVDKAVVLCFKPGELSQALVSYVTVKNNTRVSGSEIESHLRTILPPHMIPHVIVIDSIPLLENGKADRQRLLKRYELMSNEKDIAVDCDYENVPQPLLPLARVLFPTVASVIGSSARAAVTIDANFYDLGGNSLNSVYTVTRLLDQGYRIGITDFIRAKNMGEILRRMRIDSESDFDEPPSEDGERYVLEELNDSHRKDVIEMITDSYHMTSDLEKWLPPVITREHFSEVIHKLWDPLVEQGLSFVVKSTSGEALGVTLNFDARDEPEVTINSMMTVIFDFFEYLEEPIREGQLPKGKGQIFHGFMIGTNSRVTTAENVALVKEMEDHMIRVARQKGFAGILATNVNPLTQQLATDVYHYEVLLDYQVNKYVASDGSTPFGEAPDSQRALCCWKKV